MRFTMLAFSVKILKFWAYQKYEIVKKEKKSKIEKKHSSPFQADKRRFKF